jgi:hypothetical protein
VENATLLTVAWRARTAGWTHLSWGSDGSVAQMMRLVDDDEIELALDEALGVLAFFSAAALVPPPGSLVERATQGAVEAWAHPADPFNSAGSHWPKGPV